MSQPHERILIENITVPEGRRPLNAEAVKTLSASMSKLGLHTPITILSNDDGECVLVAGAHRLAAAKTLAWKHIDCFVIEGNADEAAMWEISENLHRAELTVLERADQISKWIILSDRVSAQLAQKVGRPEGGQSRAARELNIERTEVHRAAKVSSLSDEAKAAAIATGLDDNQSALLAASKAPLSQQAQVISDHARRISLPSQFPIDEHEREIKWRRAFERVWNDCPSLKSKEWAIEWMDRPIMDQPS